MGLSFTRFTACQDPSRASVETKLGEVFAVYQTRRALTRVLCTPHDFALTIILSVSLSGTSEYLYASTCAFRVPMALSRDSRLACRLCATRSTNWSEMKDYKRAQEGLTYERLTEGKRRIND